MAKTKKKTAKKTTTKKMPDFSEAADAMLEEVELPSVKRWLSTGCTVLDLAVANQYPGGIPVGRIVQCFGASSTCKSVLGTTVAGSALRAKMDANYGDVEHTLDPAFAMYYGCDMSDKRFHAGYPETLEDMFERWLSDIIVEKKAEKSKKKPAVLNTDPKLCVVDSISALPAEYEVDNSILDKGYSPRARQMSKALRKFILPLALSNTTLFCIDQTRDKVGSFVGGETVSGGRSLKFYASTQIYLQMDSKVKNKNNKVIGHWVKFDIVKNKVGPPYRQGRFLILFDYGLDDISSNLYFLSFEEHGKDDANKLSTKITLLGEEKKMSTWVTLIEKEGLEQELREAVVAKWKEVYAPVDRKPRIYS